MSQHLSTEPKDPRNSAMNSSSSIQQYFLPTRRIKPPERIRQQNDSLNMVSMANLSMNRLEQQQPELQNQRAKSLNRLHQGYGIYFDEAQRMKQKIKEYNQKTFYNLRPQTHLIKNEKNTRITPANSETTIPKKNENILAQNKESALNEYFVGLERKILSEPEIQSEQVSAKREELKIIDEKAYSEYQLQGSDGRSLEKRIEAKIKNPKLKAKLMRSSLGFSKLSLTPKKKGDLYKAPQDIKNNENYSSPNKESAQERKFRGTKQKNNKESPRLKTVDTSIPKILETENIDDKLEKYKVVKSPVRAMHYIPKELNDPSLQMKKDNRNAKSVTLIRPKLITTIQNSFLDRPFDNGGYLRTESNLPTNQEASQVEPQKKMKTPGMLPVINSSSKKRSPEDDQHIRDYYLLERPAARIGTSPGRSLERRDSLKISRKLEIKFNQLMKLNIKKDIQKLHKKYVTFKVKFFVFFLLNQ